MLVVALLLVVGLLAFPGTRQELRASFTRLPTEYLELSFDADPVIDTVVGAGRRLQVGFLVANHVPGLTELPYRITVVNGRTRVVVAEAITSTPPYDLSRVVGAVRLPRGHTRWTSLEVTLLNRPEHLVWHNPQVTRSRPTGAARRKVA